MLEKMIRGWRVRDEGPGYVVFFDPSIEHVVLYEGPDLAYEVREGDARQASSTFQQLVLPGIVSQDARFPQ